MFVFLSEHHETYVRLKLRLALNIMFLMNIQIHSNLIISMTVCIGIAS